MTKICELDSVSMRYHDTVVLSDFNASVERGERVAVIGPSGSGKTTLLNLVGMLERPSQGVVRLFERPAPRMGSRAGVRLLRHHIGYLFQNAALIDSDTVAENLTVAQRYLSLSHADKAKARRAALELVGLTDFERRRVYGLSGGEQQRLALARLLVRPAELVLADEPTGSLDPENRDRVLGLLGHLHNEGSTILVVTHDATVADSCDRVIELGDRSLDTRPADVQLPESTR